MYLKSYLSFILLLIIAIVYLQYDLWGTRAGVVSLHQLQASNHVQMLENQKLKMRNDQVYAEVVSLRSNDEVLEGLARQNLGLIKQGEVFYELTNANDKIIELN